MIEVQYGINERIVGFAHWITFRIDGDLSPQSIQYLDYCETGKMDVFGNETQDIFYTKDIPDWYDEEARNWISDINNNFKEFKDLIQMSLENETVIPVKKNMELYAFDFGDD